MKNIHLLPTDKPSRLHYSKVQSEEGISYKLMLNQEESKCDNGLLSWQRHIYITSDEEIKVGDWVLAASSSTVTKCLMTPLSLPWQKIILTTDQGLIKDGIQAIDDEFLEWFCSKNGEVDFVEVIAIEDEKN